MIESEFSESLKNFVEQPHAASAFALINSCKTMIVGQARGWRDKNLTLTERIREIMSEILLILLEDFSAEQVKHPHAVLAYLQMKIRRLTRPYRRRETAFGNSNDMSELGRSNFSALRLQFADEIYQTVRQCLLGFNDAKVGLLEFLFIHVYPELSWASKMLAQKEQTDVITQSNADKKRHSRFNLSLRSALKNLRNGDFFEISDWSGGERSHLAWRLINIAPCEIAETDQQALVLLENWRETIDRRQPQPQSNLEVAERLYWSMKQIHGKEQKLPMAAEEAEPYGEQPDLLLKLIGGYATIPAAHEDSNEWNSPEPAEIDAPTGELFLQLADQVSQWLNQIVAEKTTGKSAKKSNDQW